MVAAAVAVGVGDLAHDASKDEPERRLSDSVAADEVGVESDVASGALRWRHAIDGRTGVVADADAVYVHDGKSLLAVGHGDGVVRWRVETTGGVLLEPLRAGVPLLGADGVLRLVAAEGIRWEYPTVTNGATAITAGSFVMVVDGDTVTCLLPDGRELWQIELAGVLGVHRFGEGSGLLLAPTPTALHALHPLTGAEAWTAPVNVAYVPPVGAASTVVVASGDQVLFGLDRSSGEEMWRAPAAGLLDVSSVGDGEIAVVTTQDGVIRLRFLDSRTGTELGTARLDPGVVNVVPVSSSLVGVAPDRLTAYDTAGSVRWELDPMASEVRTVRRSGDHLLLVSATEITAVTAPR